jgi:ABC-type amino acid transport substrate-binding protein
MRRPAAALLAASLPLAAAAQETPDIRVAFVDFPPYAIHDGNGVWLGYAVEAWRIMAERNGWTYNVTPLDLAAAQAALAAGSIDVALPVPATAELLRTADLALPLHTASMGVAAARETIILDVLRSLLSPVFLQLCAGISVLLLTVGALVWLVERKRNGGQFSPKVLPGLGDGFWFAGVTLSTIGYGDKTPITFAGRMIAMLWMLVGVIVTAGLTATIVTIASGAIATDGTLRNGTTGAVAGSPTALYLEADGRDVRTFPSLDEAVAALEAGTVDQVAAHAPTLRAAVADVPIPLAVEETQRDPLQVTIALRRGSPLLETLNFSVLDFNASDGSRHLRGQYLNGD